jgi:hypothetical protein
MDFLFPLHNLKDNKHQHKLAQGPMGKWQERESDGSSQIMQRPGEDDLAMQQRTHHWPNLMYCWKKENCND